MGLISFPEYLLETWLPEPSQAQLAILICIDNDFIQEHKSLQSVAPPWQYAVYAVCSDPSLHAVTNNTLVTCLATGHGGYMLAIGNISKYLHICRVPARNRKRGSDPGPAAVSAAAAVSGDVGIH